MMGDQQDRRQNNMSMDETEDEEVKRNCFGKKYYESHSEDDDDDSEESDDEYESIAPPPLKFVSHNRNVNVHKPTALAFQLQRILEKSNDNEHYHEDVDEDTSHTHVSVPNSVPVSAPHHHKRKHMIHNECEFSDEEDDCSSSDDESDSVSVQSSLSSSTNLGDNGEGESDAASISKEEDMNSTVEESDSESEISEEDSDEDGEEESLLEGDAEFESSSAADDDDSESDESEVDSEDEPDDEDALPQNQGKVILDWGQHSPSLAMKVSGDDSVSAEDIEHLIEKEQSAEICFSDQDEAEDEFIDDEDVMKCLIDTDEDAVGSKLQPLKRALSAQQFMDPSFSEDSPNSKRSRGLFIKAPTLPVLSLGKFTEMKLMRRCSPHLSTSSEEEKVDSQLAEELMEDNVSSKPEEPTAPVPLLTPPATPIEPGTSCEWPSNLAVDNAITAAIELRSLSPSSLAKLEEQNPTSEDLTTPTYPQRRLRSVSEASTGLTPLLYNLKMHPMFKA